MAAVLVTQIQIVMLAFEAQSGDASNQVAVLLVGTPLAFVGLEFLAQHTQRDASIATIAVGAVGE